MSKHDARAVDNRQGESYAPPELIEYGRLSVQFAGFTKAVG